MLPNPDLAPYIPARDTPCGEDCPHYGTDYPHGLHWKLKAQPTAPRPRDGAVMRWLIRLYSSEWHWPGVRHFP